MRRVNQRVLIRCVAMMSVASLLAGVSCSSQRTNTRTSGPYTTQPACFTWISSPSPVGGTSSVRRDGDDIPGVGSTFTIVLPLAGSKA